MAVIVGPVKPGYVGLMPRVPAPPPDVYDTFDYFSRSSGRPTRVSGWEIDTDLPSNASALLVTLQGEDRTDPVCVFLSLPAAHQIGKALRQAVKDCLNEADPEATEEI